MGHCLKIISDNIDEQLKEFLTYFKVDVTKDDVFSVCYVCIESGKNVLLFLFCWQSCNSRSFVKLSRSTMLALKETPAPGLYVPPDYDLEDEATGFSSDDDVDCDYAPGPPVHITRKWDLCEFVLFSQFI